MRVTLPKHLTLLTCFWIFAAGCNREPPVGIPSERGDPLSNATTEGPASPGMDFPLQASEVGSRVELVPSRPVQSDGNVFIARFKVTNTGSTTLVSSGTRPVRLGIQLVELESDGSIRVLNKDFVRASLPPIASQESAEIDAAVPLKMAMGYSLLVLPVQEGVAWFDHFGQEPLIVGPVRECGDGTIGLCVDDSD